MSEINLNLYERNPKFRVRKFNKRIYIFDRKKTFEMNLMALEIWKNVGKNILLSDLEEKLYGRKDNDIKIKLEEFIVFLLEHNIVLKKIN